MSVKKSVNVLDYCGNLFNGIIKNGSLTPGYACINVKNSYAKYVCDIFFSRSTGVYFVCTEDDILTSTTGIDFTHFTDYDPGYTVFIEDYYNGQVRPIIINGDIAIIHTGQKKFEKVPLKHLISKGLMHSGRLFGAHKTTVRWSGPGGFMDWEDGIGGSGYLELDTIRGAVHNMLVFNGKIVAVREFGLTIMSMYGSPENFSVEITDTDCDAIQRDSACVFDGKLYFYSATGLKCFDGSKITPIEAGLGVMQVNNAVMWGSKYFLCGYNYDKMVDCIACVDLTNGDNLIISEYALRLYVKDNVRMFNDYEHKNIKAGGNYSFESSCIDFGTDRPKTVTGIKVGGRAEISISNGKYTRRYSVNNDTVRPRMRGKNFVITAEGSGELKEITLTAEVTDAI